MDQNLQALEDSLRAAVATGLFPDVQRLLSRYIAEVERLLREAALSNDKVRALSARTHELLRWTGLMLLTAREESAAELARLKFVHQYDECPDQPRTVRVRA